MRVTKNQLRSIVTEAKRKTGVLTEAAYMHDIMYQAGRALEKYDIEKLKALQREVEGLMMDSSEARGYKVAIAAMLDACYTLLDYTEIIEAEGLHGF